MNREAIYGALFAQLSAIPGFVTKSRLLKHWVDVPSVNQPALFQTQVKEIPHTDPRLPTKWELHLLLYIYVHTDGIDSPSVKLNALLDAVVDIVQARNVVSGRHELGVENVEWVRIDGTIETDEGVLGSQAVAIIPVQIFATD